jgi:Tol biopolymer transport system component
MRAITIAIVAVSLTLLGTAPVLAQSGHDLFQQALVKERADGDLRGAIGLYERIVQEFSADRALSAKALVQMGQCYEKLGSTEAEQAYQRVVREFGDQEQPVAQARTRLAALQRAARDAEAVSITTRRVWAGPEAEQGAPTPDGRHLVHTGNDVLTIRDLATGESRYLTHDASRDPLGGYASDAKVSPDGRIVAYGWDAEGTDEHVRVVGIDGSGARVLHAEDGCAVGPQAWSSDGRHLLAYQACKQPGADHPAFQLVLVSVRDGTARMLKDFGRAPFYGRRLFSPDDRYVAYDIPVTQDGGSYDIWLLATDGSRDVPLVQHPANDFLLGWVPGTDHMLFLSDRDGTWDAWTVRVSNGAVAGVPRIVRRRMGQVDPAGFTSDGRLFYSNFTRWLSTSVAPLDLSAGTVDEESAVPILGSNCQPMWSRDGQYLSYWNEQEGPGGPGTGGKHLLHVRHLPTGEVRELASHLDVAAQAWSRDGRSILVAGWDRGRKGDEHNGALYVVDMESGEATSVVDVPKGTVWWSRIGAVWSLDGKAIIYSLFSEETNEGRLMWRDLASGLERELYRDPGLTPLLLDLAPDGRHLVFAVRDSLRGNASVIYSGGRLMIMDLENGGVRELFTIREQGQVESLQWTPDGKHVLFSRREEDRYHVWRVAAAGGQAEKLWSYARGPFRISPDGRQVASCTGIFATEVWVMENLREVLEEQE